MVRVWTQALLLAAGVVASAIAAAAPLTLAVAINPMALPLLVAQRENFFAAAGLDVRVIDCVSGARCMKLMLDGEADVATVADTPIVFNSFQRNDFVVIGTFASSPDDSKVVVSKRSRIAKPVDLAGKRIGVAVGTSSHYYLNSYLILHGVDPAQVKVMNVAPEDLARSLAAGEVDALCAFEPYAWRAISGMKGDAVLLPASGVYTVTFNLVAQRKLAGSRDAELVALLRAVERAERFISEQPQRAQRVLIDRLSGDQALVDWVWPGLYFRLGLDQALIKTLESEARWAMRDGHVQGKRMPNYLGYIHGGPLRTAAPESTNISR